MTLKQLKLIAGQINAVFPPDEELFQLHVKSWEKEPGGAETVRQEREKHEALKAFHVLIKTIESSPYNNVNVRINKHEPLSFTERVRTTDGMVL